MDNAGSAKAETVEQNALQGFSSRIEQETDRCNDLVGIACRIANSISGPAPEEEAKSELHSSRSGSLGQLEDQIDALARQIKLLNDELNRICSGLKV